MAARSEAWVCGRSLLEIVGSNPAGAMDVCLLCVVRYRSLGRADHSSRGVLPSVIVKPRKRGGVAHWGHLRHGRKYTIFRAQYAPTCSHISKLFPKYHGDVNIKSSRCNKMIRRRLRRHNIIILFHSFFQPLFPPVAYPGILFRGGGSTNSVEDRRQRERGSGGGSPLVRGSGGSCNLVQEISFHIVKFS